MSIPRALYIYAFLTYAEPPLPRETPAGMQKDTPLVALNLPNSTLAVLCEKTPLDDWVGPDAQKRLTDLEWVGPRAIRHEAVIQWAHEHLAPIYPTSMGTIFSDEDALFAAMAEKQSVLERYFRRVDRCDQWTVKGFSDLAILKTHLAEEAPQAPKSGTDYLRRKAAPSANSRIETFLYELSSQLFDELSAPARDHAVVTGQNKSSSQAGRPLLHWHFLVPHDQRGEFIKRFNDQHLQCQPKGIELCISGPLAQYNFRE